jgi:mono/diheme cytochrome c family protein
MTRTVAGVFLLVMAWGYSVAISQEAPAASTWDGVFTEEQAKRGEEAYQGTCAACHGTELVSVDNETPSLTGPRFDVSWVGKTIGERFDAMRKTMPATEPGSLDEKTYADIIAYILKFNGYPAGTQELPADFDALGKIVVESKDKKKQP